MSTEETYKFERLSDENLKDLQVLYKDAYGADVAISFLRKKYDTSFAGLKYTGFIAYATDGCPAAYYGVFPCWVMMSGRKVLAAQSGDTMTHTQHRRKGLFGKLAQATFELAQSLGVQFIFGFPNSNSYPGFMKLNWVHDHDLKLYRFKVRTIPVMRAGKAWKWFAPVYAGWSKMIFGLFTKSGKAFPNSVLSACEAGLLHDEAFFEYKKYYPKRLIRLGGLDFYLRVDGVLFIGDISAASPEQFHTAIRKLRRLCFFLGADEVRTQLSPGVPAEKLFESLSKPETGLPACYFDLGSGLDLSQLRYMIADADTF